MWWVTAIAAAAAVVHGCLAVGKLELRGGWIESRGAGRYEEGNKRNGVDIIRNLYFNFAVWFFPSNSYEEPTFEYSM